MFTWVVRAVWRTNEKRPDGPGAVGVGAEKDQLKILPSLINWVSPLPLSRPSLSLTR